MRVEAKTTAPGVGEREMRVIVYKPGFWEHQGTRAQLEAEGVILAKTEWPEGSRRLYWQDSRFRWVLSRTRPEGLKGPMRLWTSGDWWSLRCHLLRCPDHATQRVLEIRRELAEELYWQSAAGQRERLADRNRWWAAVEDMAFQDFKAKFPGLTPAKRGRKPKVDTQGGAQ